MAGNPNLVKGGPSLNPLGRPKAEKLFKGSLIRAINRRDSGKDPQALEKIADKLLDQAMKGEISAIKELADRLDGKPAQAIVGGDDDDNPLVITHTLDADLIKRYITQEKP